MQDRGMLQTSAASGSYSALRARRVGANLFAVEQAQGCGGPWMQLTVTTGPVNFASAIDPGDDQTLMVQACEPDGTRRYLRGTVFAFDDGGTQRSVNRVAMEGYLRGVVPRESPASWGALGGGAGMQALYAQAVAARSYAASEHRYPYADTCDTTACQVYGGVAVAGPSGSTTLESPYSTFAVGRTATQVRRTSAGGLAHTEFSSSTGGWTAGGTFPAVPDEGDTRSPYHDWQASVPVSSIEATFPTLGSLQSVDVVQRNGLGDFGGRVVTIALRGSAASVSLSGADFAGRFGLRSDWFLVNPPPAIPGWFLRNSLTSGPADIARTYGAGGDTALACDWNGDGVATPGIFRNGTFSLRNSNTSGVGETTFGFGNPGDIPVCGDWNGDGIDTIGVFRRGVFYLRNTNSTGVADLVVSYGNPTDRPLIGDWNGDGIDTVGVARDGVFYLRDTNTSGTAGTVFAFGNPGDYPVAGDWNGDRRDTIGVFRAGTVYLRNTNTSGVADVGFGYGNPDDLPIAGDWNGDGVDTLGVVRGASTS
jgi:SpoIID/LytB domain protein